MDRKQHWEGVWRSKGATGVSWYQPRAELSLELIRRLAPDRGTPLVDVGGGASTLVDGLLDAGYQALTVLDLAPAALELARQRLGERAGCVSWLAADVLEAPLPAATYGVWHDRAVFHFLTDPADRARYVAQVRRAVRPGGHVIVAAFSPEGPARCSGLDVVRYGPESMHGQFGAGFRLLESRSEQHHTPGGAVQSFVYCLCRFEAGDEPGPAP
jgi:SAM-dependent methyltransferase